MLTALIGTRRSTTMPADRTGRLASLLAVAALAPGALAGVCAAGETPTSHLAPAQEARAWADYGKIPLSFEGNQGQADSGVQFVSHGIGYGLALRADEAVLELRSASLHMRLLGANPAASVTGLEPLPGTVNYLRGSDPKQWTTGIRGYQRVSYAGIYPGVDLVYYGNQRQLEYDFVVAPGANAKRIALQFSGAVARVDAQGDLVLAGHDSETRFHKPVVYQLVGDTKIAVQASYRKQGTTVHFALGAYDHSKQLIIDPVLSYATYLGGSDSDYIGNAASQGTGIHQSQGIAVDAVGSVYVVGSTLSTNFPVKNAYQNAGHQQSGHQTAFVTKLNSTGTAFVYSTYLGGTVIDDGFSIAVDAAGSAYVVGGTFSPDFPVTPGAFQTICSPYVSNGAIVSGCGFEGAANSFLTKLSPDGQSLVYSTFLGGVDSQGADTAYGVAVDAKNQAYVVGISGDACFSTDYCFPTTANAYAKGSENTRGPGAANMLDGFLSVFSADGGSLLYSTLVSHPVSLGSPIEAFAVALDTSGNIYLTGKTNSGQLSTTPGAFQTSSGPVLSTDGSAITIYERAFVEKFSAVSGGSGPTITYLTYLGGKTTTGGNYPTGIAADAAGNAYVFGQGSEQSDLPTTTGTYQTNCAGNTAYLAKLNSAGSALAWATCFGGTASTGSIGDTSAVALDAAGNVYIAVTGDSTLPQVNPVVSNVGGTSAFVAKFDPTGSQLLFSTPVGGSLGGEFAAGLALDSSGNIYLAGQVYSTDLPVTAGAAQATYAGGGYDSFIAKITIPATTATTLALSPSSITVGQSVALTATVTSSAVGAVPTGTVTFKDGNTTLATQTLNATAVATYTASTLAVGSHSITAVYSGDAHDAGSTSNAATASVVAALVTTTTASVSSANATVGQLVTLTAKVAATTGTTVPTGTVTFKNGTTILATETLNAAGVATYTTSSLPAGSYSITAVYGGDGKNATSTSGTGVPLMVVAPIVTTTTSLVATPTSAEAGAAVGFTATVTPASGATATGTVTFTQGTTTLGTGTLDASGKASFTTTTLAVGAHSVVASYGGSTADAASESTAISVSITAAPLPADFAVSLTPATGTVAAGSTTTTTVAVAPANGFVAATTLACSGLPANATCSFSPSSVTPTGTAAASSTLTIATNVAAVTASNVNRPKPDFDLAALFAPFMLLPLVGLTSRLRRMMGTGIVLAAAVAMTGMGGCSSSHNGGSPKANVTPAGTYTVTVTGTSGTLTHSATYTLVVQ